MNCFAEDYMILGLQKNMKPVRGMFLKIDFDDDTCVTIAQSLKKSNQTYIDGCLCSWMNVKYLLLHYLPNDINKIIMEIYLSINFTYFAWHSNAFHSQLKINSDMLMYYDYGHDTQVRIKSIINCCINIACRQQDLLITSYYVFCNSIYASIYIKNKILTVYVGCITTSVNIEICPTQKNDIKLVDPVKIKLICAFV